MNVLFPLPDYKLLIKGAEEGFCRYITDIWNA